jgi:hypothetical protein
MARDQELRASRLVFYERDVERLDGELDGFLELSNAKCALLIDKEGHLVTRRGEPLGTSSPCCTTRGGATASNSS